MMFKKTDIGRSIVSPEGASGYGHFDIIIYNSGHNKKLTIIDEDGNKVGEGYVVMTEPESQKPISQEEMDKRLEICKACEFNNGTELVQFKDAKLPIVNCKACNSCSNKVSIKYGYCKQKKW